MVYFKTTSSPAFTARSAPWYGCCRATSAMLTMEAETGMVFTSERDVSFCDVSRRSNSTTVSGAASAGAVSVNKACTVSLGRNSTALCWLHASAMVQSFGTVVVSNVTSNTSVAPPRLVKPTSKVHVYDGGQLGRTDGGRITGILSALTKNWTGSSVVTLGYCFEVMLTVICWKPRLALTSG